MPFILLKWIIGKLHIHIYIISFFFWGVYIYVYTSQCSKSPAHWPYQVVDCGLLNIVPLFLKGSAELMDIAGHGRTGACSVSRNCVHILATKGRAFPCWSVTSWRWTNDTTIGRSISSRYLIAISHRGISSRYRTAFKIPSMTCSCVRCPWEMPAHTITLPPLNMLKATLRTTLASAKRSPTRRQTRCLLSARKTLLQRAMSIECVHWPIVVCFDDENQPGQDPGEDEFTFPETILYGLSCDSSIIQTKRFLSCLCRWSQTIAQMEKPDVPILSSCDHTWSVGMWSISCRTK